jgi:hypothetical protein
VSKSATPFPLFSPKSSVEEIVTISRLLVSANKERVALLGGWPDHVDPARSLLGRLPSSDREFCAGFDAGIACCLGLIPIDKQYLSAGLHAAYTETLVDEVRETWAVAGSAAEWWLAACSVCNEGGRTETEFASQVLAFTALAVDSRTARLKRSKAAEWELAQMVASTGTRKLGGVNVAYSERDGGLQASYLNGAYFAVQKAGDVWFVGTYLPSLGLEGFDWGKNADGSKPVHGSSQFFRITTEETLVEVVAVAHDAVCWPTR